jgi:hypothetical protein
LCNSHGRLVLLQNAVHFKIFFIFHWHMRQEPTFKLEFRNIIAMTSWSLYDDDTPSKMFQSLPHSPNIKSLVLGRLGINHEVHTRTTYTSILLQ